MNPDYRKHALRPDAVAVAFSVMQQCLKKVLKRSTIFELIGIEMRIDKNSFTAVAQQGRDSLTHSRGLSGNYLFLPQVPKITVFPENIIFSEDTGIICSHSGGGQDGMKRPIAVFFFSIVKP